MGTAVAVTRLGELIGSELGISDWIQIDQDRVDAFADATLDHQFIHVDLERAAATPFGGTIVHGFLTLSLLPHLLESVGFSVADTLMVLNYGTDKVRFLQPVPVGSRVRARVSLAGAEERKPGQWLLKQEVAMEIEGQERPAMVAELLSLVFV